MLRASGRPKVVYKSLCLLSLDGPGSLITIWIFAIRQPLLNIRHPTDLGKDISEIRK